MVRFNLGSLLQGQMRIAKRKSAYNSFTIGSRGLQSESNLQETMGWKYFDVVRFDLGSSFKVKQCKIAKVALDFEFAYCYCLVAP